MFNPPKSILFSRKLNQLKVTTRWLFVIMLYKRGAENTEFLFPYQEIQQITGLSTSTIWRCIRELEKADLITYEQGGLEQNPNRYKINQDWLDYVVEHGIESGVDLPLSTNKRNLAEWKKLRWKVLQRDGYKCTKCPNTNCLEIHHLTYERYGKELLADLITLCTDCHRKEPINAQYSRK